MSSPRWMSDWELQREKDDCRCHFDPFRDPWGDEQRHCREVEREIEYRSEQRAEEAAAERAAESAAHRRSEERAAEEAAYYDEPREQEYPWQEYPERGQPVEPAAPESTVNAPRPTPEGGV